MISSSTSSKKDNTLTKLIKSVDHMGLTPQFQIEGKEKYNTILGGTLSILIYCISVLACFFFGKELYLKQDPSVILSNYFEYDPRPFNLTRKNFNFFVGIEDVGYNYYIDPSIYTLKIGLNQITAKTSGETGHMLFDYKFNLMPMEQCNLTKHFDPVFQNLFKDQDLGNLLCFDPAIAETLRLAGSYGNANFQYIEFTVEPCKNATRSEIVCKPESVINEKLQGGFFIINFIETIFDPKNFSNPNVYIKRDFFTSMSNKFFKEITLLMKNIDYVSDVGILMSSEETRNFIQTDEIREVYDFRDTDKIISAIFRLSFNRDVVKRRYLKLQHVIAQVGGFIKGIMLIIAVFNYFYSTTNFYIFLMNKLYFFDVLDMNQVSKKILNNHFEKIDKEMNNCDFSDSSLRVKSNLGRQQMSIKGFIAGCDSAKVNNVNINNNDDRDIENSKRKLIACSQEDKNVNSNLFNVNTNNHNDFSKFVNESSRRFGINKFTLDKIDKLIFRRISRCENDNKNENSNLNYNSNNNAKIDEKENNKKSNLISSELPITLGRNIKATNNINLFHKNNHLKSVLNKNSTLENNQNLKNCNKNKNENIYNYNNENLNNINYSDENKNKNIKLKSNTIMNDNNASKFILDNSTEKIGKAFENKTIKNNSNFLINYSLCEKIILMFGFCFKCAKGNKNKKEKSLELKKRLAFESCCEKIKEKFDAFKYLKISDDLKIIKSLLFTEDQINVINLIEDMKHKFNFDDEKSTPEIAHLLKKIEQSSNCVDKKIKLIMLNNQI